jgi:hypothetical protein
MDNLKAVTIKYLGLGLISAPDISAMDILAQTFCLLGRFGTCTLRHFGNFNMWTLRHRDISAQGYFCIVDISAHGHFGTVDISAHGHFGTVDISAREFFGTGHFGTGFFSTFQVGNFLTWAFQQVDILAWWTFRLGDFLALDVSARIFSAHFSSEIF